MTLTRRLLLLALISVLPAVTIWAYTDTTLRRAREAEVKDLAQRQAQLAASELERIFEGVESVLATVAEMPLIRGFETERCAAFLAGLRPKLPQFLVVGVIDASGRVRCASQALPPDVQVADRDYLRGALRTGAFTVGTFVETRATRQKALPFALPLRDEAGRITGVVAATLNLDWLGAQLRRRALPEGGSLTVADREGVILAREPLASRFVGTRIPDSFQNLLRAEAPGAIEVTSQDGTRRVLGYVPVGASPRGLYISAGLSTESAYGAVNTTARRGFVLLTAAFGLTLLLAWLGGRSFLARPFRRLITGIHAWRRGDYDARIAMPRGSGEFGLLAETFNKLIAEVQRREAALRESEERARLALEAGQMGTWWFDPRVQSGAWSETAARLLGQPPTRTRATFDEWRALLHPEDVLPTVVALQRAMTGDGDYEAEYRVVLPDGGHRWISARGKVFFDEERRATRIIGIFQDVTQRRHADAQQRLLLDELNHRVKNTLATVQSIAAQTLRTAENPAQFREAFEARVLALSKTHDLLTRNAWRDADLAELVGQELAPYGRGSAGTPRWQIAGPPVRLPARAAINLGLVIHELVTNAAKYGALSGEGVTGHVAVQWTITPGGSAQDVAPRLRLTWQETGGPPVAPPRRKGFGSRLIERSVTGELSGTVRLDFRPAGLCVEIAIPLEAAPVEPFKAEGVAVEAPETPRPAALVERPLAALPGA